MKLLYEYMIYFYIYALFGWIVESIYCSTLNRKIINRGFLNGPICPVYGIGAVVVILSLYKYRGHIVMLFLLSVILTSIIEYLTSMILEKLFKTRWWDYSNHKYNIKGRVCLLNSTLFGILSLIIVNIVHPNIIKFIDKIDMSILYVLLSLAIILTIADIIVTAKALNSLTLKVNMLSTIMEDIKMINLRLKIYEEEEFIKIFKVNPETIMKKMKSFKDRDVTIQEKIDDAYCKFKSLKQKSFIHRRLINAFPDMKYIKSKKRDQHLQFIKKILKNKGR